MSYFSSRGSSSLSVKWQGGGGGGGSAEGGKGEWGVGEQVVEGDGSFYVWTNIQLCRCALHLLSLRDTDNRVGWTTGLVT